MDPSSRQSHILNHLETAGASTINELAEYFDVSDETVRRDVKQLEIMGYVHKYHGGVRLPESVFEAPFRQRQHERAEAKQLIGARAARLIEHDATVMMESSTTAFWVARNMTFQRNISVITNGLDIARELCGRNNNRIYLAGGETSDTTMSTLGPTAIEYVKRFTPDLIFIGASGLDAETGLCDFNVPEADFAKAMLTFPSKVVLVADATKFDRRGLVHVCDFSKVDVLVTDKAPTGQLADALSEVEIIVAGVD